MDPRKVRRAKYCAGGVSLCCLVSGIGIFALVFSANSIVNSAVKPYAGMKGPLWVSVTNNADQPQTVYFDVYVFNLTNPHEVAYEKAKPIMKEIGPFIYLEDMIKGNISYSADRREVSYTYQYIYKLDANLTRQAWKKQYPKLDPAWTPETPKFCHANFVFYGMAYAVQKGYPFGVDAATLNLLWSFYNTTNMTAYWCDHTADEMVYGYIDPFLTSYCQNLPDLTFCQAQPPGLVQLQKHNDPWLWGGITVAGTGYDNISDISQVKQWGGRTELEWWSTAATQKVQGSDGTQFHTFLDKEKDKKLTTFVDQIYRTGYVEYNKTVQSDGVELWRYLLTEDQMQNATLNPYNAGYNAFGRTGTLNLTSAIIAVMGVPTPVFASMPYWIWGDPSFRSDIDMQVLPQHDNWWNNNTAINDHLLTSVDVEPTTGATVQFAKRLQMSIRTPSDFSVMSGATPVPNVLDGLNQTSGIHMPVFWADSYAYGGKKTLDSLKSQLSLLKLVKVVGGIGIAICFVGMLAALFVTFFWKKDEVTLETEQAPILRRVEDHEERDTDG